MRIALLLLACGLAFAQSPSSPVIRIDVNLVQVDAVVTDSKGRHVSNLTADDFLVLQDGKPPTISNFSYIGGAQQLSFDASLTSSSSDGPSVTPEPALWFPLALGLSGMAAVKFRRRTYRR